MSNGRPDRLEAALRAATDFPTFAAGLLRDELRWPLGDELAKPQDVSYPWSEDELGMPATGHKARAFELLLLPHEAQPWGIFLLEFDEPKVFDTRGFGTPLRAILRRLVASSRKDPSLRSWSLANILFICTHDYQQYVFAAFRDQFGTGKVADARLATFGWNKGQPCRTVVTQNLPHLCWPEDAAEKDAWLSEWARAFDKQPLTDTFFKAFNKALEAIKTDLEKLGKLGSTEAYSKAQLLLERLVFLYFVQNRGWLDQRPDFLKAGFEKYRAKPQDTTYYSQFLEHLFWSLSSAGHKTFPRDETVPFLNGGLFNDDEFEPSPRRESANPPLRVRNVTFVRVFDEFLEAFNFTVREDTPLNQDVAVDPEMLGKVFESIVLHAESADPDATAPDKRKETGSFYTPRIVVHFNCREVLYQWLQPRLAGVGGPHRLRQLLQLDASDGLDREELETLKQYLSPKDGTRLLGLLEALRCCDPAVGSGAFMVGLLHELTNLRRLAQAAANGYVDPVSKDRKWLHETKAHIIENCLFGVDIQQQAIEICMLRLWLSLVVDYDLGLNPFKAERSQFLKALADISHLPNLEMNFKRGDSLHDHICGVPLRGFSGMASLYRKDIDNILAMGRKLHGETSSVKKLRLRLGILRKRMALARQMIAFEKQLIRSKSPEELDMGQDKKGKAVADAELAHLDEALSKLEADEKKATMLEQTLEPQRDRDGKVIRSYSRSSFLSRDMLLELRKLEGATLGSDFNFAWRIDFPQVFWPEGPKTTMNGKLALGNELKGQMDLTASAPLLGGFDIFVGNPPFVTARNPVKRELYRERWQPYCHMKYHLLVPFFPLSFSLMKPGGELGFIVSNAFAKREFGKPLVEQFFPRVDLHKVVDCSGLMFPGHGTPTCLVFGAKAKPDPKKPIRVAALLPGGGDLGTPPEESRLWHTLEQQHDSPHYDDGSVTVSDRTRAEMHRHPWLFSVAAAGTMDAFPGRSRFSEWFDSIGVCFFTNAEEVFLLSGDFARRLLLPVPLLEDTCTGEDIRNWTLNGSEFVLRPYDDKWNPVPLSDWPRAGAYLRYYRKPLGARATFSGITYDQEGKLWYGYHIINHDKLSGTEVVPYCFIATHNHFVCDTARRLYRRPAPIAVAKSGTKGSPILKCAVLNSSAALFWLKQVCFSKRESEEAERDTYYEFAGGKVEQLPVPGKVAQALTGEWNPLAKRLAELAEECWRRGQEMPSLSMKKLFEKPGEAYHEWNSSLPGYEKPHPVIGKPFGSADELKQVRDRTIDQREKLRREMVALQEEMDWLVYAAYSLLPEDHPAVSFRPSEAHGGISPDPLDKDQRPYRLWQQAEGDFAKAVGLISSNWADARKRLWRERLAAIRDNEHIRRIEQPVYKRRWDEQWKVKNRWECGPVAYEQELTDAFDWWLLEKAEWYLEHKKDGGPAELSAWAQGLWRDPRIQAAVEVVDHSLAGPEGFIRLLREKVDEESVPEGIPFAKPWEELEKKFPKSELNKARKIRGKLNVPRERFHLVSKGVYAWAGLLFR